MPAKEFTNGIHVVRFYPIKHCGGTAYQLAYREGGVRRRHTYARAKKAETEARLILTRLSSPALAATNVTSPGMESFLLAEQHLADLSIPVHVAAETFALAAKLVGGAVGKVVEACEYYAKHAARGITRRPIADDVEDFVRSREQAGLSPRYIEQCRGTLKKLWGEKGLLKKGDLDFPAIEVLSEWLLTTFPHPVTRNANLRVLKVFTRWRVDMGRAPFDPFARIKKAKVKAEPVVIYTPAELRDLLKALEPRARFYAALGAFSGLRRSELHALEWEDVNLDRGYITVAAHKAKTAARRLVPISDNLRRWLEPARKASGLVIELGLHRMSALIREAGVVDKKNALRHSYVSYRLAEVQDTAKVALEAGNSPEVIFQHYREVVTPEEAKEWFAITPQVVLEAPARPAISGPKALPALV